VAQLVDDLDATVTCRHCGRVWPDRMQSCPNCLAELHVDPAAAAEALADVLASGHRLPRPTGVAPFSRGLDCTLMRTAPRSSLLFTGPDDLVEAYVDGRDHTAVPPLHCRDVDEAVLFRLVRYEPAPGALVAVDPDGAPLGTYLRLGPTSGHGLDVRDETSAPVARLLPPPQAGGSWALVETGGTAVASCQVTDVRLDGFLDDEWSLRVAGEVPLRRLAVAALVLACKVLLGRPAPVPAAPHERQPPDDEYDFEL
jgi:hypothetical protein